jgi:hypothetical protein
MMRIVVWRTGQLTVAHHFFEGQGETGGTGEPSIACRDVRLFLDFDGSGGGAYNASAHTIRIQNEVDEKISGAGERSTKRSSGDRRLFELSQTLPFVGGNGPVDDRAAINAFPGIEDEEEV